MSERKQPIKSLLGRGLMLCMAVLLLATVSTQVLNTKPVFADDGGYPWIGAHALYTAPDYTSSYGYSTCPPNDSGCMNGGPALIGTVNGVTYGEADPWNMALRNCTGYVAWKMKQVFGSNIVSGSWGNAADWDTYATGHGYSNDSTPQVGDIAQWNATQSDSFGHVAYVWKVVGSTAYMYDYNVGWDGLFYPNYTSSTEPGGAPNNYIHIGTVPTSSNTVNWSGNFVSTWGVNRLDAFTPETWSSGAANTDHKWNNGSWQSWDTPLSLGQQISSWPSAVSWGSNRIDLFARDTTSSHHLLHAYYDTNGWHNWDSSLGGCITGAPAVSSWGTNRLDVFAQGCGDNGASLNHIWYDGTWHAWETLPISGGQLASAPAAVSWGSGRIDVFAQNYSDNSLIHTYYDANGWHNWTSFSGSCITGAPGVSSWGTNRLDVFAQGCGDNGANTNHIYYNGSWQSWETLPNNQQITSSPSAVSWSTDRIDLFARDSSGHLSHRYYDTGGWHAWESLGGTIGN